MGRSANFIAWMLAITGGCGVCSGAQAQTKLAPLWEEGSAYRVASEVSLQVPSQPALGSDANLVSYYRAGETSLVDEVAAIKAELKKMKDKAAKAKKKADSKPTVTAGGRIYADWAAFGQNSASLNQAGDCLDGAEFRRARIFLKGKAFHVTDYKIEMDFAGQTTFKDVYMTIKELPVLGHVRIGHFKEPWSLEEQTSSRFITFMERSLNNVFSPQRNMGVMAFDHSQDVRSMHAAVG